MTAPFVLHVGLTKTGTSTLQRALFEHHSEICFLGKWIKKEMLRGCCSYQIYKTLKPLIWQVHKDINIEKIRTQYVEKILPLADGKNTLIASWESLGGNKSAFFEKRLRRVSDVCGNSKCMITLRNPLTRLPAWYLQAARGHYLRNRQPGFYRGRPYLDFQKWLHWHVLRAGSTADWLCYAEHVENAVAILGEENVGVFVFEQLKDDPIGYYASVARFLNIGIEESLALVDGKHYNKRLSESQLDYIRNVDLSLGNRLRWRFSSRKKRRHAAGIKLGYAADDSGSASNEVAARVELTPAWKTRICEATRAGHLRLSKRLNIDLGKYGYPV